MPNSIYRKLIKIKRKVLNQEFSTKSYSQEGEDILLKRIFKNKANGFYIDVGAHHPKKYSNTYLLHVSGWTGINIDAMPGSMTIFNRLRPNDINLEIPISNKKEKLTYYIFKNPAFNGFSKELSEKRIRNNIELIKTIELRTQTLDEVLDLHVPLDNEIDLISIDVEGYDFNILKSINLERYKPKVIIIEELASSIVDIQHSKIFSYLNEYKYTPFSKTYHSTFYIKQNLLPNLYE